MWSGIRATIVIRKEIRDWKIYFTHDLRLLIWKQFLNEMRVKTVYRLNLRGMREFKKLLRRRRRQRRLKNEFIFYLRISEYS